jgi:preprotein translocase subunit SecD
MDKQNKTYLFIALGVLLFLVVFGYIFYRKGKKTVSIQDLPQDLPGSTNSSNNASGASNTELKMLVNDLYKDMNGVNILTRNIEAYQKLLTLSDTDTVKVYNAFNTLYQIESKETLKSWISNETGFTGFTVLRDAILSKFTKLNFI